MSIRVVHGASESSFELSGLPIETVAELIRDILNIPSQFISYLDGHVVSNKRVLNRENKVLEFVKPFGHKGGLPDFWSKSELFEFFGNDAMGRMIEAGLDLESNSVIPKSEVIAWNDWLQNSEEPRLEIPARVDIKKEIIQMNGVNYRVDQEMAAIVKCILDAKGAWITIAEMQKKYPEYIVNNRVDNVIRRKLYTHKSGIGDYIEGSWRGYHLTSLKE
ncbi:hypothetical protein FYZ48_11075 [Gimesia chilikensis]|uniref:hypothetical protein n=1 Tax=Gimesia chilikensis TaxID=2605989 RepID=UPI0011EE7356|nr:hypothetical protein [Gimesia chilikensis]KAA0139175.1 hypothetical protein FYZ48_11075 [Gimesia chilikensis]